MKPSIFAVSSLILLAAGAGHAASTDSENTSTVVLVKPTQIPGQILKAGTYSVRILDHLSDRMVIRVANISGKPDVIFLAVPGAALAKTSDNGPIVWQTKLDGKAVLRGFKFPSGYTVEFVYPKSEAALLAKANEGDVLAVDPDSEGRPALPRMTSEDRQMVHLWMLSLTKATPDGKTPALSARAYQPRSESETTQIASNSIPAPPQAAQRHDPKLESASPAAAPAPRKHPAIKALPHTASSVPFVGFAACFGLIGALFIRLGRRSGVSS